MIIIITIINIIFYSTIVKLQYYYLNLNLFIIIFFFTKVKTSSFDFDSTRVKVCKNTMPLHSEIRSAHIYFNNL